MSIQTNTTFEYKGYEVAYHQSGNGDPIIMLHNAGCSHIIWKHQIEHFSKTHRVIAFDLLGFGDSGRPRRPFTLELYVDVLRRFISENKLERPVLMGNCIGAAIALEYTRSNPDSIRALVLCNVCGGVSMMRYFHPYMFPRKRGVHRERIYKLFFSLTRFEFIKKEVVGRLYGSKPNPKSEIFCRLVDCLRHPMQPQSRIMMIKGLNTFNKFDHYTEDVSNLPPTLLFWGKNNRVLPVERGELLMKHLHDASCHIYPDQGHLLMAENPGVFNRDVEVFLTSL